MIYSTLPNLISLAILVAVFWTISRKQTSERLHLWLAGWVLILLHFTAQFFGADEETASNLLAAVSYDCLILASIAFVISVSSVAATMRRQIAIGTAIAVPCLALGNGAIWQVKSHGYYYFFIVVLVVIPLEVLRRYEGIDLYFAGVSACALATGATAVWAVLSGHGDLTPTIILTVLNFAAAGLYWRHHKKRHAGVLTTVAGFFLWGLVFPTAMFFDMYWPKVQIESEVWNIPKYLVALGMILTLLESQIERSNYLAYHDELTGLPNRRLLDDRLDKALARARRVNSKVAVLLLDLDHFKEVNDTFGHRVGDMTLQAVVGQLSARIRSSDTLARSGGDEFTVVSEVPNREGAAALASALESALSTPILVQDLYVRTGLSVGVALYPDDGSDPDQLHAAADKAMYMAKRAARNSLSTGKRRLDDIAPACASPGEAQANHA
jgi:diguanylate cyclase (GGDEF)-like protein